MNFSLFLPQVFLLLLLFTISVSLFVRIPSIQLKRAWNLAIGFSAVHLAIALIALFVCILTAQTPNTLQLPQGGLKIDVLASIMHVLVAFLALVILNYSRTYLEGEANQKAYMSAFLFTVAAVYVVTSADHLLVMIVAWSATSFSLHRLLMFYPQRSGAVLAAHKKFLASRCAELLMLAGVALIYVESASLSITELAQSQHLSNGLAQSGLVLISLGVIFKSALLPAHGWLIQVMEAPTPVSALLHAGVVNLGGFALIRMSAMFEHAAVAQGILVLFGSITALGAALVMMTRISIKVRLAWSTCAQMGFMIMTCGLGLYDLAMLHLLGHSLYKAYAFLSAGSRVHDARLAALQPMALAHQPTHRLMLLIAPILSFLLLWMIFTSGEWAFDTRPIELGWIMILSLAWAPLLWLGVAGLAYGCMLLIGLGGAYLSLHSIVSMMNLSKQSPDSNWMAWAVVCLSLLYFAQVLLHGFRESRLFEKFYPWVYGGFYLDEIFTRWTFLLWPIRMPARSSK